MSKCDIAGCGCEMVQFDPIQARVDGTVITVLSTSRSYLVCNNCLKKLGLVKT